MKRDLSHRSVDMNVVAIGGGNGMSTLLQGLKTFVSPEAASSPSIRDLSAIVAVTDDGGSSGRLREELRMLPPGDIRNCMVALSEDSGLLSRLFQFRFTGQGALSGHSFGNLFLAALTEITGDFAEAVKLSSEILASKGHIYPATVADVRLVADLEDGRTIRGETNIGKVGTKIRRLYLEPENCKPLEPALEAIENADLITVGPGSLFTSLIPPILVRGVAGAIAESAASKIYISNLMTQPGETDGFSAFHHLECLRRHAPEIIFDYVVVNDRPISSTQVEKYAGEGAEQIGIHGSISSLTIMDADVIFKNLLDDDEKVRHHPDRLARAVLSLAKL
ncbi:MAG: YvcK family protein [Pyrinomonadaceae bacterium]